MDQTDSVERTTSGRPGGAGLAPTPAAPEDGR